MSLSSIYFFLQHTQQVLPIPVFRQGLRELFKLSAINPLLPVGNFLRAGHLEPLAVFQRGNELAGIKQRFVGSCV
jgi:hypothetical protein